MNQRTINKVFDIIDVTIKPDQETAWETIRDNIKPLVPVKNWLDVRGVLQWMIDEGMVKRTDSVHVEHYVRLK